MKKDDYKRLLGDLEAEANIEGSCIVSRDGMLIHSKTKDIHPETFAAMSATLLSSAEVAMDEIKGGVPKKVVVDGKNKKIIVVGAGPNALLAVITSADGSDVYDAIEKSAKKIGDFLSEKK
ncbi:MAG TPA: hypothetical protein ENI52_03510 [Thermoplasmata archaeon]|nr:hypothetical protein [Thermoplasmata archaeon]